MLRRGALNADKTNVPAVNHSEAWNFDKTGNWLEYNKNGMTETRTHNVANELQGIATHDANGNMVLMPGLKGKYDAWNRLVEVRNADDVVIATYEYNGLNQRIKKTVGGVLTKSFYNENWQGVESVTGSQMTSYVWGLRYIDDLVLREKRTERLYSLMDANWNVIALVDASGAVVERMKYDAFGKITWLGAGFGVKAASDYVWNRTFTGQVLDVETGLMLYRNRYYHTGFGRFVSRDPIGYRAGDENVYRYLFNMPAGAIDSLGLQVSLPQPSPCPIISKYLGRCACGNLRNREGKDMTISNNVFNRPEIIKEMDRIRESIQTQICKPDNTEETISGDMRPHLKSKIFGDFGYIISDFDLSHEATTKPSETKKSGCCCYDVTIKWKFKDHIDAKDFRALNADVNNIGTPWADYPEGIWRNCIQNPTNADFWVHAEKTETFTHCCCSK